MQSVTRNSATKLYNDQVERAVIARTYLKSELPNILAGDADMVDEIASRSIDLLSEDRLWRLCEALSYTYRLNGVFHVITNQSYTWIEAELPIEAITLTGTRPRVNDIVYSEAINRHPKAFAKFLHGYFRTHPQATDDPAGLNDFRPQDDRSVIHNTLMTVEREGKIKILDGTHRLMTAAMRGENSVRVFAAIPNGRRPKYMTGDSSFLTLRKLYERYRTPEQRKRIIDVAADLARVSTDGRAAVQNYWIDHPRSRKVKDAGLAVLYKARTSSKRTSSESTPKLH